MEPNPKTGSEQYMEAIEKSHMYIDCGHLALARYLLTEAQAARYELDSNARFIYYLER